MSVYRGRYVGGAATCAGGPTPGSRELMSWWLANYSALGATNLGIYNCRPVRGSTAPSVHGTGRGVDLGTPVGNAWSFAVADKLRAYSAELGIQCLIHRQPGAGPRIWSCSYPDAGWRKYTGVAQHKDHIHAELTGDAGRGLTVAHLVSVLGGRAGTVIVPLPTTPRPTIREGKGHYAAGTREYDATRYLQETLRTRYPVYARQHGAMTVDGKFGPTTGNWVGEFQRRSGMVVDEVVGPMTWAKLG